MYNTILLNNNTFNPYVSVLSKHTKNPLVIQLTEQYAPSPSVASLPYCIERSCLPFYNPDNLIELLKKIQVGRYEYFGGQNEFSNAVKRKIDSPKIYVVEIVKRDEENEGAKYEFYLVPFAPRKGSEAIAIEEVGKCIHGPDCTVPGVDDVDLGGDDDLGGGSRRRRIKKKNRKKKTRRRKKRKYKTLRRRKKYRKRTLKRKKRKRKTRFKK